MNFNCVKIAEYWLRLIDDRHIIIQSDSTGNGKELTPEQVKELASGVDQIEISHDRDLPYARTEYMLPTTLTLCIGDEVKACKGEPGHAIYFVSAYIREEYDRRLENVAN